MAFSKKHPLIVSFLFLLAAFYACQSDYTAPLQGHWQGTLLLEGQDSVPIDPTLLQFSFTEQGKYSFNSTLNQREAGTYRMQGDLLYTRDTLTKQTKEKVVRLEFVTPDSLVMNMQQGEQARVLYLVRK